MANLQADQQDHTNNWKNLQNEKEMLIHDINKLKENKDQIIDDMRRDYVKLMIEQKKMSDRLTKQNKTIFMFKEQ